MRSWVSDYSPIIFAPNRPKIPHVRTSNLDYNLVMTAWPERRFARLKSDGQQSNAALARRAWPTDPKLAEGRR